MTLEGAYLGALGYVLMVLTSQIIVSSFGQIRVILYLKWKPGATHKDFWLFILFHVNEDMSLDVSTKCKIKFGDDKLEIENCMPPTNIEIIILI